MTIGRRLQIVLLLTVAAAACGRTAEDHLARGDAYAKEKNYEAAIIEYRNALQKDAQSGRARYHLAAAYIETSDPVRALQESIRAADLLPNDADVQVQAANLLILAGAFADARDRASKAVKADPRNVRAQIALGNALAGLRDLDGAIAQVEEALQLDPGRVGSYSNLASLHAAAGRVDEAEKIFKEAVATHPDSISARLTLAHFYWILQRNADAEAVLGQALAMAPSRDTGTHRFAAAFYLTIGQTDKAEQHLRIAVDNDGAPSARLTLAEYYVGLSRLSDAVPIFKALTTDPIVGSRAQTRLAAIDYSEGRVDTATAALDRLLEQEPRNIDALVVRASILYDQRRLDEALARTDAAVAADPASAQAHFARGRVLAALQRPDEAKNAFNEVLRLNPRAGGAQVELAKLHLDAGATDTAVTLAAAVVKSEPQRSDARLLLARGLMARGELLQAESVLNELRAAVPDAAVVHAQLGLLYVLKKDRAAALAAFERALALDPLQIEAAGGVIGIDWMAGRHDSARARLQALVERAPRHAPILGLAGRVHLLTGNLDAAEEMLKRAIEADPAQLDAYTLLANVYLRQDRLDEARQEFERLAERQTRPIAALTMVGLIFGAQQRTDEATRTFERVMQLDSRAAVAANNLAWIYAEHGGNLDMALQLAQSAKAALPDEAPVNDTLGWILLKKDLLPLAIVALRQAVDLAPENATYHYHLGMAYARSGDADRAKHALQTALRLNPAFDGASEASRMLTTL